MNFAPYQDESPELERVLSPPPPNGKNRASIDSARIRSPPPGRPPPPRGASDIQSFPPPSSFANESSTTRSLPVSEERGQNMEAFQTSLPMRLDHEAMLAYLLLPPAGGVFLLLFEHKSDYVRFHAWQSSMVFSALFVIHLLFSWSRFLSWTLFLVDVALIAFLTLHAYRDVDTLDHYELPVFGHLANSFVDDE